jgi:hypothetical protein
MRLAALFLALVAALPAWANYQSLEILGWSSDEQRFALRVYDDTSSPGDSEKSCPGYVNHKGNPFTGSLKLGVYEQGKEPIWFPIQDAGKCTPPKKARERLDKAKQELARLGIDLGQKQPGTQLGLDSKGKILVKEGPGAPYTFEYEQQVETSVKDKGRARKAKTQEEEEEEELEDEFRVNEMKGEMVVFVRKGEARTKLFSEPVYATFIPGHGEQHDVRLANVWLSPSGKRAVFISQTHHGHPRDSAHTLRILGMVSVDGTPVVLR